MELNRKALALPWEFDVEEVAHLQAIFSSDLVQAYLQALKHMALSNRLIEPNGTTITDVKAANDYMAGQEFTLDALLATPIYIPTIKESHNV